MSCFSRANHASTNLKKVLRFKTRQVYFIYPFLRRLKLGKSLQRRCVILSGKSPYFGKHLFAKQELITRARLRGQDFATGKNFSFNQCHTKSFAFFSRESYFIKAIENFFPVFAYPDINTRGVGKVSTVMQTLHFVSGLLNCLEFSQTFSCLYQAMQKRKTFSIA